MGVIRVTRRPYYYAQLAEKQAQELLLKPLKVEEYPRSTLVFRFEVAGLKGYTSDQQPRLRKIISSVFKKKGRFVREHNPYGSRGYYDWGEIMLSETMISTGNFDIQHIEPVLELMKALHERDLYPADEIEITYHPEKPSIALLVNLTNIIESRRPLIETALLLEEPFLIVCNDGFALSIKLGAFSYTAVEATAYIIAQACKMAQTTGKSRMKPCDMANPKYQMRSWLLRLGFIGEQYARPRKTLLEALEGDTAFYSEDQKQRAVARRKARKMNGALEYESA